MTYVCIHGMVGEDCTICLHGVTKPERVIVVGHVFTARFDGECGECDLPIGAGQQIFRLSNDRYVHEGCVP